MQSMIRNATRLLLGMAVVAAAACGGESGSSTGPNPEPGPSGDIGGSYALTQVRTLGNLGGGGAGLPADFVDGSGTHLVFNSGTLILGSDGAFDLKVQVTFKGSAAELTDYGTYSVSGGTIDFNSQKSTPRLSSGTINGNKLTAKSQFAGIPFEIDVEK